jgi:hypothetical protein
MKGFTLWKKNLQSRLLSSREGCATLRFVDEKTDATPRRESDVHCDTVSLV